MELTTQITDFLKAQSVQIAAVFAVVLILHWLLRNRTAHIRYLLWLLVAVKCMTPPLVIFSVPVLPTQPEAVIVAPQPQPSPALTVESQPTLTANPQSQPPIINQQSPIVNHPSSMNKTHIALILYAAGGVLYFLWAIAKSVHLHRRLSALRRPLPEPMAAQIADLARLWHRPTPFAVWLAESISQPFVWGLWRGAIYLPARLQSIQTDRQKAVVMHEMSHVVRFDALVNCLQILVQGIFWFHPLVWLANRFIRAEREKCCDEIAVARLGAVPKEYGSAIIDTLLQEYQAGLAIPTLAVAGPVKNIEDRIKTLMQPNKRFYTRPTAIATLAILTLAALIVPTTVALTHKQEVARESIATMLSLKIKVIDENGTPITNAEIFPDGLRTTEKGSGHYLWDPEKHGESKTVLTDNAGFADILYPKYTAGKLKTGEVSFSVRHPEYCPNRIFERSLKQPNPVVLKKGTIVRISGYIGNKNELVVSKIYPQASSGKYRILSNRWKEIKQGVYECKEIESGTNYLRLVHFTNDGKIYFSETLQYQAQQNQVSEYNLELKPGVRVIGQLDKSVPRPVTGGKVVAMVAPAMLEERAGRIAWQTWGTIDSDGTFVFESLPPDQLQLTGLCDGFVASNHDDDAWIVKPQLFTLDKETVNIELRMNPAAICEVKVVDNANQPIKGAKVVFGQCTEWRGGIGTTLFPGFLWKSEETIAMDENKLGNLAVQLWKSHFQAITNNEGIAVVRNLPGLKGRFHVSHNDYEMIPDKKSKNPEEQEVLVDLVGGQTSTVTIEMQKKWKWLFWEKSKEVEAQKPEAENQETEDKTAAPFDNSKNLNFKLQILPAETETINPDTLIAIVLGKVIYARDIEPVVKNEKYRQQIGDVAFYRELKNIQQSMLKNIICMPLLDKYAADNGIAISQEEIEEFGQAMIRQANAQRLRIRTQLAKELENPNITEARKKDIESRINSIDQLLAHNETIRSGNSFEGIAKTVIRGWKTNKSLFEAYGGRVIFFQQGGSEPLDAYREFLKQQETAGQFEIQDKKIAELFWNYFTNDKIHTFYSSPEEAQKYISNRWWLNAESGQITTCPMRRTASLPNGVTVELVGLCEHPSEGKSWWKPDGSELKDRPYRQLKHKMEDAGAKLYELAFRVQGGGNILARIATDVNGIRSSSATELLNKEAEQIQPQYKQDCYETVIGCNPDIDQMDITILIGSDLLWKTDTSMEAMEGATLANTSTNGPSAMIAAPIEKDGHVFVNMAIKITGMQFRAIAMDENGKMHISSGSSTVQQNMGMMEAQFDLPLSEIKSIQFQTQKFQPVIFKNVSLKPGEKTDVKIEIPAELN